GAQAQPVSGGNQAAVQAGVQAAVQDGIQTIRTARIQKAQGPIKAHQSTPAHRFDQSTLVAQANSNGGAATPADQSAVQAADQPPELQEVVVTGTLIRRPSAETAEAITILNADTLKNQGVTNVEQAMNTLTANTPQVNISSAVGTFSGGG